MRKIGIWLFLGCAVLLLGMPVSADGAGRIQVRLKDGERCLSGVEIGLYRAGTYVPGGYRLTGDFGGGMVSEADVLIPELAAWMEKLQASGDVCLTNDQGVARFEGLEEGLYLVTQKKRTDGYLPMEPFLVIVPWDGSVWDILAEPILEPVSETPDTSDPGIGTAIVMVLASGFGLLGISTAFWTASKSPQQRRVKIRK